MRKLKIYLSGHTLEFKFRDYCKKNYGLLFDLIDPISFDNENWKINDAVKRVESDTRLMHDCDILVAYINQLTSGTLMEIYHFSFVLNRPVYIINPNRNHIYNYWLVANSIQIFENIDSCFKYIIEQKNKGEKKENMERKHERHEGGDQSVTHQTILGICDPEGAAKIVSSGCCSGQVKVAEKYETSNYEVKVGETEKKKPWEIDDSKTSTRLLEKNYSPMIVRKYQMFGWPLFVGLICDYDLSDLDKVVHDAMNFCKLNGLIDNNIQHLRNACGYLSESIEEYYNSKKTGCVEGIGIFWYVDKCGISSLKSDIMTHLACRMEFYSIINTLPHI